MEIIKNNQNLKDFLIRSPLVTVIVERDLAELLPDFIDNRLEDSLKLSGYLEQNDFENIKKIGHDLRGVPGAFGYDFLVELGSKIESAAKVKDAEQIKNFLQEYNFFMRIHEISIEGDEKIYHLHDFLKK